MSRTSAINPFYARVSRPRPRRLRVLDLFSGIGGFSLGFERAGMQTVAFCEIDPFCQDLLGRPWPGVPVYPDIHQLTHERLHHDGIHHIDIICGGYPCQPFSIAGHRSGARDPRHLWPEMHRLIRELRPRWVVCENVAGHIELGLDTVLNDLDALGYDTTTFVVPACAVGAPHRRDRLWIVANSAGLKQREDQRSVHRQSAGQLPPEEVRWELPAPFTVGSDDGVPARLDRSRGLGNAVVPQIPELIGRAISRFEIG